MQSDGPYALVQCVLCLALMAINTFLWVKRKTFSKLAHSLHFFIAAVVIIGYMPHTSLHRVMSKPKFTFTLINLAVMQIALVATCALTNLHKVIVMLITAVYFVNRAISFYDVQLSALCKWDYAFHIVLAPLLLTLIFWRISAKG